MRAEGEMYGNGALRVVYKVRPQERLQHPNADLVKEIYTDDRFWSARLYLRFLIARHLFPENFIEVVGCTVEPGDKETYDPRATQPHRHLLYSKLANVSSDHAVYSSHMELIERDMTLVKASLCDCQVCVTHRQVHTGSQLRKEVARVAPILAEAGFHVQPNDPSDYCFSGASVLFFEIDRFVPEELRAYLEDESRKSEATRRALVLLDRHDALLEASRKDFKEGRSDRVDLN